MPTTTPTRAYPTEFIRRVIDDIANQGVEPKLISALTKVQISTVRAWQRLGQIRKGQKISEKEMETALWRCQNSAKLMAEARGLPAPDVGRSEFRTLTKAQAEYVQFGAQEMKPPQTELSERELMAFGGVTAAVDRQLKMLAAASNGCESPEELARSLVAAIGLKQLREVFTNPPPIGSWKDAIGVADMTFKALGITNKETGGTRVGVDVNILSHRPAKVRENPPKKTIDVQIEDQELED
jgi:hypothetical protein